MGLVSELLPKPGGMTGALSILSAIMSLVVWILKQRYSTENIQKRTRYERGKELAEQDSIAISKRLYDLHQRLRLYNRKKKR